MYLAVNAAARDDHFFACAQKSASLFDCPVVFGVLPNGR